MNEDVRVLQSYVGIHIRCEPPEPERLYLLRPMTGLDRELVRDARTRACDQVIDQAPPSIASAGRRGPSVANLPKPRPTRRMTVRRWRTERNREPCRRCEYWLQFMSVVADLSLFDLHFVFGLPQQISAVSYVACFNVLVKSLDGSNQ